MAFRKVTSGKFKYVKYKDCKPGQVLAEGTYLGTRDGTYGLTHQIATNDGIAVLNSSGQLNYQLKTFAAPGSYIRVTYVGQEVLEKGKFKNAKAHQFELEVDDERASSGAVGTVEDADEGQEAEEAEQEVKPSARLGLGNTSRPQGLSNVSKNESVSEESVPAKRSSGLGNLGGRASASAAGTKSGLGSKVQLSSRNGSAAHKIDYVEESEVEEGTSEEDQEQLFKEEESRQSEESVQEVKTAAPARTLTRDELLAKYRKD